MIAFTRDTSMSLTSLANDNQLGSLYQLGDKVYRLMRLPIKINQHEERIYYLRNVNNPRDIITEEREEQISLLKLI